MEMKANIVWGISEVKISLENGAVVEIKYTELICSFLKVDMVTRTVIGRVIYDYMKKMGLMKK